MSGECLITLIFLALLLNHSAVPNGFYSLRASNYSLYISGVNNAIILCNGSTIKGVVFQNNTYNDTLRDCNFSNATIESMGDAQNNIISPKGSYNLVFGSNSSNVAIGYKFTLITYNRSNVPSFANYIDVAPEASKAPRFGVYNNLESNGILTLYLESELVGKGWNVSYNPYYFTSPYWGLDILSYKLFNITEDMTYAPSFIAPQTPEYYVYPLNESVYYNFTVIKHSGYALGIKIFNGYQFEGNDTVLYSLSNVTNGTIVFDSGAHSPGIHEYIGMLYGNGEQDNSTTETYSVGITYCAALEYPGYYTMPYHTVSNMYAFWLDGKPCVTAVSVQSSNVTVNCEGASLNSTGVAFNVADAANVTIENCRINGNGILANNVYGLKLYNITISPYGGSGSYGINATESTVRLYNVSISGMLNAIVSNSSKIDIGALNVEPTANAINNAEAVAESQSPVKQSISLSDAIAAYVLALLASASVYVFALKRIEQA